MSDQLKIPLLIPEMMPAPPGFLEGLNDEQRDAATAPANQALQVLAGAGTGKTELIARRFVKLCRDFRDKGIEDPESRILVVTFTSDAAEGMRTRIRQRLRDETGDPAEGLPDPGNRELGNSGLGNPEFGKWIGTFHQFCMRVLRTHAPAADLPPDFAVLNTMEQQILFNRLHTAVLAGDYPDLSALLRKHHLPLNPDILSVKALQTTGLDDPEAVLEAGQVYRLINQIKTAGLSPERFLEQAVSQSHRFTERLKTLPLPHLPELKAPENLQLKLEAWREMLSPWAFEDWDPVAEAEAKAESKGRKATASVYRDALGDLCRLYLETKTYTPLEPDFEPLDRISAVEERLVGILAAMYALYQEALVERGACDFDDLINHTTDLLSRRPELREQYRRQFEAIIVDEFQDSNGAQLRLLELLARDRAENLTVVGDIKQSIYSFRFAQPENLDLVFRNASCKRVYLRTNYRSLPPVLQVANHLTEQMTRDARQLLSPPDSPTQSPNAAPDPKVVWVNLDRMIERDGKPVHPPIAEKRTLESRYIATEIDGLVRSGAHEFSDIAVLVRSHARAENIQEALAALNIPSVRQKDLGFFQQPVIKDAMALMRLMRRTGDDFPLVRVLQRKLNQKQLYELMRLRRDAPACEGEPPASLLSICLSLSERESPAGFTPEITAAVSDLARRLVAIRRQRMRLRPAGLFMALADAVGLIDPDTPEWRRKQQRLALRTFENLLTVLAQGRTIQPTLEEVLELLEQYAANPAQPLPVSQEMSGENAVRIMTIFAAKGLEFPVVFAACVEKPRPGGRLESILTFDPQYEGKAGFGLVLGKLNGQASVKKDVRRRCWSLPRAAQEARRVFYVALTRAKERLYVIRCPQSEPWTDPDGYPASSIQIVSEAELPAH